MTWDHLDQKVRESLQARRNYQFGIWAGRRLGHRDDDLVRYAKSLTGADHAALGSNHVIARVHEDLWRSGIVIRQVDLLAKLESVERDVSAELCCTD